MSVFGDPKTHLWSFEGFVFDFQAYSPEAAMQPVRCMRLNISF